SLVALAAVSEPSTGNPIEVGTVAWGRDFEAAVRDSERTGKPVFAFFQEVPGCAGCRKFGSEVMSDSTLTQAIENEFIPVLIYNNRPGKDADLLRRYGEPAWNYQVIRFLDENGRDLIPRKDRVWTLAALSTRMIEALEAAGRTVPRYLEAVALESDTARHGQVAFAQHCFWTGEAELGGIEGVISTEAGWVEGREVTLVRFDRGQVSVESLTRAARAAGLADRVYRADELDGAYRLASDSDQKRQIRGSVFDDIALSPMQRTKVNAFAVGDLERALEWLTPEQREQFDRLVDERR
ncbi:MAG: VPGUxxT family thioredoxin-like (seleno)protein, type 2, partial [Acidobacteriota bacterium]|nr:VPGUxxT family thioredoxin-like (seleno)protein, type 2 [Acidobacteriota bacterium]